MFQASGVRTHLLQDTFKWGQHFQMAFRGWAHRETEYTGYLGACGEEVKREWKVRKGTEEPRWAPRWGWMSNGPHIGLPKGALFGIMCLTFTHTSPLPHKLKANLPHRVKSKPC